MFFRKHATLLTVLIMTGMTVVIQAAEDSDQIRANERFFESKVRPLLIEHCVRCHGGEKQEGGLRLDNENSLDIGGESGPVLDRVSPEKSLLLSAIHYRELEMPPTGKLPEDKIETLERWIASGAAWPEGANVLSSGSTENGFSDEDRAYWFFQNRQSFGAMSDSAISEQIDLQLESKLREQGLAFAESAAPLTLVRRVYLDLLGVTPTPSEVTQFLEDTAPEAFANLVDRLLDDPRYGERWGRFWLDLVRYAESDGYKQDDFRPTAYRYRDYVIHAFNQDKAYRDFVCEQLAGDEMDPDSLECRDASGYLRLWIYEYNQKDVIGQWNAILNDLTDVTGEAFLGLGYSCARCHDHKFDPLLQKDYFRLQAYFSGLIPRDNLPAATTEQIAKYIQEEKLWKEAALPFLDTIESIERPIREKTIRSAIDRFPPEVRPAMSKSPGERSPREKQLAHLASLQQDRDVREIKWEKAIPPDQLDSWRLAKDFLKHMPAPKPLSLSVSLAATDVGTDAAEVYVPGHAELGPIQPGIPSILNPEPMPIRAMAERNSTGRRTALAEWVTQTDNPFTWRVIVNRVWQQHFGTGIVANASDFGRLTESPSHPELLDLLADQFAKNGGKFKSLHRWVMNTRGYRQSAYPTSAAQFQSIDPNNKWIWKYSPKRLDADQIRDSILSVSSELGQGGANRSLRSIYVRAMRNSPDQFLALFDAPDASGSIAKRNATTTPLQSLMMMNSDWVNSRAKHMAEQIVQRKTHPDACIDEAFQRVFLHAPTDSELQSARAFLGIREAQPTHDWQSVFADYCHVLINSNSFLYVE